MAGRKHCLRHETAQNVTILAIFGSHFRDRVHLFFFKSTIWSPAYINEIKTPTSFLSDKCPCPRGKKSFVSQGLTTGFNPPGERPTQPSRPRAPPRPPVNRKCQEEGLDHKNSKHMWRFCDITRRNRPVLSLHHRPSLLPSERPRSPNKETRAC